MDQDGADIHKAYALRSRRKGKTVWVKWKDIGEACFEFPPLPEHLKHLTPHLPELLKLLRCHVDLDATPIGGFDGYVRIVPPDVKPEDAPPKQPDEQPNRPAKPGTDITDEDI
jgi:hypothetical protein